MGFQYRAAVPIVLLASMLAISCGGGGSASAGGGVGNNQNVTVSVSPLSANVSPNGTQPYTATVTGTSNTGVTWSVTAAPGGSGNVGTISPSGLYTAPGTVPNPSNVTITATSTADTTKSGTATANVLAHHINQDPQSAPIKLGTSGGNATDKTTMTVNGKTEVSCCSGTLGSLISRGGNQYILSNNHVLDKSNQATIGDPISQPGLADTNCGQNPNITVAHLSQSVVLPTDGKTPGTVDAAMAQIVGGEVDTNGTILDLAAVGQAAPPSSTTVTAAIGQGVAKSGDATGLTCSSISVINTSVGVDYTTACGSTTKFHVVFNNEVFVSGAGFSNSGDSGSLIVTSDLSRPVALLYAGSSSGTVGHPIQDVLTALKDPSSGEAPKIVGGGDHAISCPPAGQSQVTTAREKVLSKPQLADSEVARATAAKNHHSSELMQDPAVTGVGVGQSADNPAEAAVIVFLKEQPRFPIPAQMDGVRTKIIPGTDFRPEQLGSQQRSSLSPSVTDSEVARVRTVKEKHAEELMSNPVILGVGVGASSDGPGQAAMVVFVQERKSISIPPEIEGARTRVVVTDPFRAFDWGTRTHNSCSASRKCGSCGPKPRGQ